MGFWEQYGQGIIIILIILIVLIAGFIGYKFLRKKIQKKMDDQQVLVEQHKVPATILVLEKRKDKITNANIPKSVMEQIPKVYKIKKVPIVKAKIGPQVMDLLCDEDVFDKLPERKAVRVDLAGIFIAAIKQGKK
ncbi:MAG TPA: hypothetical protein PK307_10515 [Spirochaetota bacterium]|nr:hypothetical protein [Spirochaetota bacterium]HOD14790.1 hypothetical protein [Spirochaetota bacterium]HPG49114.1 hypothetical protein [Spirochaetota bacterium]HPN11165.1 hypothetical protein [Spirochaetota bacterium]HQL82626.1 hypothetical protein [Spirochaetota bacterium]